MVRAAIAILLLIVAAPVGAAGTACSDDFAGGEPPTLVNPKLARDSYPLCLSGFATLFSGVTRTPVYSAEHLTAARIDAARSMVRVNSFHPELQLPEGVRSELSVEGGPKPGHSPATSSRICAFGLGSRFPTTVL